MKNRFITAIQEPANVLGLATSVALFMASTLNPLPLLVAAVAEAAYLIFVPDSKWYERRLSARYDAEVFERQRQLKQRVWPHLSQALRDRFDKLVSQREQIGQQASGDEKWLREIVRKLDFLLEKWLQFALKEAQFRQYLYSIAQEQGGQKSGAVSLSRIAQNYDAEIELLQHQFETETEDSTKAILGKRVEVVQRRKEFAAKIARALSNLDHQLDLLQDTFALVREEMLARSPDQVLGDIDDVVSQTNIMMQVLEDLAPYERLLSSPSMSASV